MATTYGMTAPMMSSVMPNPTGMTQPTMVSSQMTPSMMGQSPMGMNNANMNLPLSTARPIEVTETTPNLEQIQGFPVVGRAVDGTHFHQDPVSGQMYRMTEILHQRIPQIIQTKISNTNILNTSQVSTVIPNQNTLNPIINESNDDINQNIDLKNAKVSILQKNDLIGLEMGGNIADYVDIVIDNSESFFNSNVDFLTDDAETITLLNNEDNVILSNGELIQENTINNYIPQTQLKYDEISKMQIGSKSVNNFINTLNNLTFINGSSREILPTNRFLNLNYSSINPSLNYTSYFIPINRFINR
jgi:hypothetical protein